VSCRRTSVTVLIRTSVTLRGLGRCLSSKSAARGRARPANRTRESPARQPHARGRGAVAARVSRTSPPGSARRPGDGRGRGADHRQADHPRQERRSSTKPRSATPTSNRSRRACPSRTPRSTPSTTFTTPSAPPRTVCRSTAPDCPGGHHEGRGSPPPVSRSPAPASIAPGPRRSPGWCPHWCPRRCPHWYRHRCQRWCQLICRPQGPALPRSGHSHTVLKKMISAGVFTWTRSTAWSTGDGASSRSSSAPTATRSPHRPRRRDPHRSHQARARSDSRPRRGPRQTVTDVLTHRVSPMS
jgi:hypothetical protein